jgi:hypothetical protein
MKREIFGISLVCFSLLGALPSMALVNGGFESGFPADFGSIESWEVFGNANARPVGFTRTAAGFTPSYVPQEGSRMALFSSGSNDFSGSLSQAFATVPGTTYRLSLKLGIVSEAARRRQALEVTVADGAGASILSRVETIESLGRTSTWADFSTTFVASGIQTRLTLSDHSETIPRHISYNSDLLIDQVSIVVLKPGSSGETIDLNNKLAKFYQWMSTFGITGNLDGNPDKDGMINGVEYVIGGNPVKKNGSTFLPKSKLVNADPDGDGKKSRYLIFAYRRSQLAAGDEDIQISVEWRANTKEQWQDVSSASGVVVKSLANKYPGGIDLVSVYIPRSITKSSKLFTRLNVVAKQ